MKNNNTRKGFLIASLATAIFAIGGVMNAGAKSTEKGNQNSEQANKKIDWQPSLAQARKEAKRTGKPIMIVFHASWCGACRMLDNEVLTDSRVVSEAQKWIAVRVDVDKNPSIAESYRVESLPTLVFLKSEGNTGVKFEGAAPANEMLKVLKAAHDKLQK